MEIFAALGAVVVSSIVIMFACNSFDDAASHLGRNMAPGVRGATINAVGSSMPELLTATFLLFLYQDRDGFAAGIATTAGSAVSNAVVIPAVCIFAVRYRGVLAQGVSGGAAAVREKVKSFEISKSNLIRDGFFLLIAEAALIWFLGGSTMTWWMGAALLGVYGLYFIYLARGFGHTEDDAEDDNEDEDDDSESPSSKLKALLTFDFNTLLFDGRTYSTGNAWVVLSLATGVIAAACWLLAVAVMASADAMGVPPYFTALVFAAAATSVPDTVLSVKDAMRGEYDDALSNAIGSNTFDITVGLGLPLLLYALIFNTDVAVMSADETQLLRIVLFGVTIVVLALLLLRKRVTVSVAYLLSAIYVGWMGFVIVDTLMG